jgi:hypothetical protein
MRSQGPSSLGVAAFVVADVQDEMNCGIRAVRPSTRALNIFTGFADRLYVGAIPKFCSDTVDGGRVVLVQTLSGRWAGRCSCVRGRGRSRGCRRGGRRGARRVGGHLDGTVFPPLTVGVWRCNLHCCRGIQG